MSAVTVRFENWSAIVLTLIAAGCSNAAGMAIVDRPSSNELVCNAITAKAKTYDERWGAYAVLGSGAEALWSARVGAPNNPDTQWWSKDDYKLSLAPLDAHGAFGRAVEIPVAAPANVGTLHLTQIEKGSVLFWTGEGGLWLNHFDEQGERSGEPQSVAMGDELFASGLRATAGETGGILATWYQYQPNRAAYAVATDSQGVIGEVQTLATDLTRAPAIVAAPGGGYAALWSHIPNTLRDVADITFVRLDESGRVTGTPQVLSHESAQQSFGFGGGELDLLALEDGYLATWTGSSEDSSVIYLARLAPDGSLRGAPVLVAEATHDVDLVEPGFTRFGDSVALLWARGSVIYVCGGCTPDHSVHMLVIDPQTLMPKSNEVTIDPPAQMLNGRSGGLLRRNVGVVGERDIAMLVSLQFHTDFQPAFGAFHCEPK